MRLRPLASDSRRLMENIERDTLVFALENWRDFIISEGMHLKRHIQLPYFAICTC